MVILGLFTLHPYIFIATALVLVYWPWIALGLLLISNIFIARRQKRRLVQS